MTESNFQIEKISEHNYVIRSDSDRHGSGAIVFQGISFKECLGYIERHVHPKVSYFVIDNFSCMCRWTMTERQKEEREADRMLCYHIDDIKEAVHMYKELVSKKDWTDTVINKQTGQSVPEVALGVCVNGMDLCDVLYASSVNKSLMHELCTDFIIYTGKDKDIYKLGYLKKFMEDMNYVLSQINVTRARYLESSGSEVNYHFGTVSNDYFEELPTLRTYEKYGEIR